MSKEVYLCILGKSGAGKTRLFSSLLEKKHYKIETIDVHEGKLADNITLLDTPSLDKMHRALKLFDVEKFFIVINGSKEIDLNDIEMINYARRTNKPFEVLICFGDQYYDQIIAELPANINVKLLAKKEDILNFKQKLILKYGEKIEKTEEEEDEPIKLNRVVVGKENAGKSTLINHILGVYRVSTSAIPGTTKMSVDLECSENDEFFKITDTAGIKRGNLRYIHNFLKKDSLIIFMIDASEPLTHQDKSLLEKVYESGLSCVIALNKIDINNQHKEVKAEIEYRFKHIPIIPISAKDGKGIKRMLDEADKVEKRAIEKISTNRIAQWAQDCKHLFHNVRVKYGCHVSLCPYKIMLFVSPARLPKTTLSHIKNLFYKFFDVKGVCIKFEIRAARSQERANNKPEEFKGKHLRYEG